MKLINFKKYRTYFKLILVILFINLFNNDTNSLEGYLKNNYELLTKISESFIIKLVNTLKSFLIKVLKPLFNKMISLKPKALKQKVHVEDNKSKLLKSKEAQKTIKKTIKNYIPTLLKNFKTVLNYKLLEFKDLKNNHKLLYREISEQRKTFQESACEKKEVLSNSIQEELCQYDTLESPQIMLMVKEEEKELILGENKVQDDYKKEEVNTEPYLQWFSENPTISEVTLASKEETSNLSKLITQSIQNSYSKANESILQGDTFLTSQKIVPCDCRYETQMVQYKYNYMVKINVPTLIHIPCEAHK